MSDDFDTQLLELSKKRWRGDEADAGLTWGTIMVGDPFVDFLVAYAMPTQTSTLAEIGPGYGRILKTLLDRGTVFQRYIGLELSAARVEHLKQNFQDPRVSFRQADVLQRIDLGEVVDIAFGSAVFEHFYPSFAGALQGISGLLCGGALVVFDLIRQDDALQSAGAWFDGETYMRVYSGAELISLLSDNGFELAEIGKISFGKDVIDREIVRTIVAARKL